MSYDSLYGYLFFVTWNIRAPFSKKKLKGEFGIGLKYFTLDHICIIWKNPKKKAEPQINTRKESDVISTIKAENSDTITEE